MLFACAACGAPTPVRLCARCNGLVLTDLARLWATDRAAWIEQAKAAERVDQETAERQLALARVGGPLVLTGDEHGNEGSRAALAQADRALDL